MSGTSGLIQSPETQAADLSPGRKVTTQSLMELVELQSKRCALSGVELTPETASIDHKQPISRGGLHVIENIQVIHQSINAAKGNMTNDEFVAMCARVVDCVNRT